MNKHLIWIALLLFLSLEGKAQRDSSIHRQAVTLEILGSGIIIPTLNYSYIFLKTDGFFMDAHAGANPMKKVQTYIGGASVNFGSYITYFTAGLNVTHSDVNGYTDKALFIVPEAGLKLITPSHVYSKITLALLHLQSSDDDDMYYDNFTRKNNAPWIGFTFGLAF